jgi:DNA primase
MIPAGFIQELLARTDIVDTISPHVEMKRSGANWMGLCPFHAERSPSFSVSVGRQFFHCFGCGASGDAIRFLTEHLGLSFVEAVRDLAGRVGMVVPEEQVAPEERERRETLRVRRQSLGQVLEKAAAFYRAQLKASPRAIDYLKRRGLSGTVAARFGIGWAPPGWKTLAGVFPEYDDPLLAEAGLVRVREPEESSAGHDDGEGAAARAPAGQRWDWFRERVMFPIRAVGGEVIGFGGRVLDDSKPKYLNSPETPLFSKGRELYGLFEARRAIRERGFALVVEGYMDVVALAQSGFANAVATLGTACTAEHVMKLLRFTDDVVFSFDGDAAGRRAAAKAMVAALEHAEDTRRLRFLFLPPEHDPDSFVRERGAEAFERALSEALPLSRFLPDHAAEGCDLNQAEGRSRYLAQAWPLWQALPAGTLKAQVLAEIARRGEIDLGTLQSLWKTAPPARTESASDGADERRTSGTAGPRATSRLRPRHRPPVGRADRALRLLLRHPGWWLELGPDDRDLLHALPGPYGEAVAWVEREAVEHGDALTGSALRERSAGESWAQTLGAVLVDDEPVASEPSPEASAEASAALGDLRLLLAQLRIAALQEESHQLVASGVLSAEGKERYRALGEEIAALRSAAMRTSAQADAKAPAPRP